MIELPTLDYPQPTHRRLCGDCGGLGKTVQLTDCPTCHGGGYEYRESESLLSQDVAPCACNQYQRAPHLPTCIPPDYRFAWFAYIMGWWR